MTIEISQFIDRDKDTICAVITPQGLGGVSVIRLSGEKSLKILKNLAKGFKDKAIESHRVYYSTLLDRNQQPLDEVLFTFFKKGKSFTSEECVEISCHGNPVVCSLIVNEIIYLGARHAERGEFTYRAFINGRLDLTQAESVLDLIQASSQSATKKALRQLDGALSTKINYLEDLLTWCLAHIEAGIDFSTEGLEVVDESILLAKIEDVLIEVKSLKNNFDLTRQVRNGLRVALVGEPNVGKSSLLNMLLLKDRALVSEVAGTTRDSIDGEVQYNNLIISFVDTAGIRKTEDQIERLGVNKTFKEIESSDFIIYVFDASLLLEEFLNNINDSIKSSLKYFKDDQSLILLNKVDLLTEQQQQTLLTYFKAHESFKNTKILFSSTVSKNKLYVEREKLLSAVFNQSHISTALQNDFILINQRQFDCLCLVEKNIESSLQILSEKMGAEFVALELKEALMALQELVGKKFDDQIMDRVFKEFCIGK